MDSLKKFDPSDFPALTIIIISICTYIFFASIYFAVVYLLRKKKPYANPKDIYFIA